MIQIDWDKPIRTKAHKDIPTRHQRVVVFDGEAHILTFKEISNPVLYDHYGNPLAQINKEYLSYNMRGLRDIAINNGEPFVFDIENYLQKRKLTNRRLP